MPKSNFIGILVFTLFLIACHTKKRDAAGRASLEMESPYFGQKPPGLTPVVFAPGIVSVDGRYEGVVSFSPDFDEMYFSPTVNGRSVVYFSKLKNGNWTQPKESRFTKGKISDEFVATVSHSGERIYFSTYDSIRSLEIWYVNRRNDTWGDAILLDSAINKEGAIFSSEAKNGDLFYINNSKRKMYYAPNKNGEFSEAHDLGIDYGTHGFISPSQDFLLVGAHKENDTTKDKDLYIYFKGKEGKWSNPINLGTPVNTSYREGSPTMTPDGKYLFFNRYDEESGNPNIYWVDAQVFEKFRPKGSSIK